MAFAPSDRVTARLESFLGSGNVRTSPVMEVAGVRPGLEVFPADPDQLAAIMAVAGELGLTVCPAGGGTKLGWGAPPRSCDLLVRTVPPTDGSGALAAVIEYDPENLTLAAGSGVRIIDLQTLAAADDLILPLDPPLPNAATLGGVAATNDHGPRRLRYGSLRDVVLGVKAVLAGGGRIKAGGRTIKNVTGYDLTRLFVGSFGSQCVMSEITVRLLPRPESRQSAVVVLRDAETAFRVVEAILASQLEPTALSLVSPALGGLLCSEASDAFAAPEGALVLIVAAEGHPAAVGRHMRDVATLAGGSPVTVVESPAAVQAVWTGLDEVRGLARRAGYGFEAKIAVPIAGIWPLLEAFATAPQAAWLADVGCGTAGLWLRSGIGGDDAEGDEGDDSAIAFVLALRARATRLGGSLVVVQSHLRAVPALDPWGAHPDGLDMMRRLKRRFDPLGLLNPGRNVGGI
jgi:glycolate oxidase FAD binding subunit